MYTDFKVKKFYVQQIMKVVSNSPSVLVPSVPQLTHSCTRKTYFSKNRQSIPCSFELQC